MLEVPHVIAGLAIGRIIPNPIISIPVIFLSHFILDQIPHWNPKPTRSALSVLMLDFISAVIIISFFVYKALPNVLQSLLVLTSCIISILPDLVQVPYHFLNIRPRFLEKFVEFQTTHQNHTSFPKGIISQLIIILVGLLIILH